MSSITLKITSLVIRTLSKPIANQIKAQVREHPRFRRLCIHFAQSLHRVDMRLRLGLLRDTSQAERHAARDPAEIVQAKKQKLEAAERAKDGAADATAGADEAIEKTKEKPKPTSKPRIRPLTEAKAIDTGATFLSETFLFIVAGSLIVLEAWRSRRKENTRREDIADRLVELEEGNKTAKQALVALEKEVIRLRTEKDPAFSPKSKRILPEGVWSPDDDDDDADPNGGGRPVGWWRWLARKLGMSGNRKTVAAVGADVPQQQQNQQQQDDQAQASEKDNPLATRIAHSVASIRRDATPPPTSLSGETEAIIDSTS